MSFLWSFSLACLSLILLNVVPGLLFSMFMVMFPLGIGAVLVVSPIAVIWLTIVACQKAPPKLSHLKSMMVALRRWIPALLIGGIAGAIIVSGLPRRLVFQLHMREFDRLVTHMDSTRIASFNSEQKVGPYKMKVKADSRGGIYFSVWRVFFAIDTITFGFARNPNSEGSPFGNANYHLYPLVGSWYGFTADNDW